LTHVSQVSYPRGSQEKLFILSRSPFKYLTVSWGLSSNLQHLLLGEPLRKMDITEGALLGDTDCTDSAYDPQSAAIEAWLDEHQGFANDYFIR